MQTALAFIEHIGVGTHSQNTNCASFVFDTSNFDNIAKDAAAVFKLHGIDVQWKLLEVAGGSEVHLDQQL